ncbi:MAG TPA: hypothetical protein PKD09_12925 [Aggregatilinea sp.]|uniref:hypothetical protein n=1 Tax=Aggregatilinea sp. TaxID=2806333 RepID=UPI002C35880C|nr:hypothetical protein [Aggregatilinea sp.]HML22549.1 hypothetical protein [Aggregatilinea sp.]
MADPQLPDLREVRYSPSESQGPSFKSAEPHSQQSTTSPHEEPRYTIRRKGSRYNLLGPHGRVFGTYKSASVVGPRWEELTHTPWPYASTAYEPGSRLRQLGLTPLALAIDETPHPARPPEPHPEPPPVAPRRIEIALPSLLALPQPRIDVEEQTRLIGELKQNPRLLFRPEMQRALQAEIEYHRPHAAWAQKVLDLEARYRSRKLAEPPVPNILDIYRNPLLALHPDREAIQTMLRDEARTSGLLADFAQKLDLVLAQWQGEPDRLRRHLHQQAEIVRRGGTAHLDHLVGGPDRYRQWRIQQNRQRNAQRARAIDGDAITAEHVAWQVEARHGG